MSYQYNQCDQNFRIMTQLTFHESGLGFWASNGSTVLGFKNLEKALIYAQPRTHWGFLTTDLPDAYKDKENA